MSKFKWNGPQTAIEIWPEGVDGEKPLFSGVVSNGDEVELPETHSDVQDWLAFGMISPVAAQPSPPVAKPVTKKDETNG